MDLSRLRNLGVVAHIDAGKTTVSERILYFSGVEHRIGQVDEGTTVLDWMPEERERGITITAAATYLPWREHAINLIDTPGHVDFTVEVERCMRVLDGAVLVIDAVAGVQAQSETVWRQMKRHGVPCVAFVNKADRLGADFLAAVASIRKRLGAPAVPIQYPWYEEGRLLGVVDLLTLRAFDFSQMDESAPLATLQELEVPAALADEVGVLRSELVDLLCEDDDELIGLVLDDRELDPAALRAALRRRTIAGALVPVLVGSALRNVGVQPLLDAIVDYLPSPLDVPPIRGIDPADGSPLERPPDPQAPLAALAFKIHSDAHGDLTFVRVYSGTLAPGDGLLNPRFKRKERVARVLRMHADTRQALESAGPGEIVALTGLKQTGTGDTLCDAGARILLEPLAFPEPVISMIVEPRSTVDRDKLRQALARLAREDPSLHEREDEDTGQWLVEGMGELHLEVALHRLATESKVEANVGKPRVAYRESARTPGRGHGKIDRVMGGKEMFGELEVELAPLGRASSGEDGEAGDPGRLEVEWAAGSEAVPEAFRPAVEEALVLGAQVGPRFGYPLVGARLRVVGGQSRPRLDAELAFVQAANAALREAMAQARVDMLEPVMRFEIQTPADFTSGIIADLNSRRAEVGGMGVQGELRAVTGTVPLAQMFGYSTVVRSLSQGRASFSMEPAGFRVVSEEELRVRGLVWE